MIDMRMASIIVTLVAALATATPAAPPTTQSNISWNLPGMSGNAEQIKAQLYHDLDDLNSQIEAAQGDVRAAQADMQKHHDAVAATLVSDDTYQYVCKTIANAQRDLTTTTVKARADQLQIKIDGFTRRKLGIEDQAVAKNADTPKYLAEEATATARVNHLKADLEKSLDWRRKLGAAVRGGELIQWPVTVGKTGIIGHVTISNVDASGLITARGQLFEPESKDAKETEGIVTMRGHIVPATFLITGWTDDAITTGADLYLDKMVRVQSSQADGDDMTLHVERYPCEEDSLLKDFHEFHDPSEDAMASH